MFTRNMHVMLCVCVWPVRVGATSVAASRTSRGVLFRHPRNSETKFFFILSLNRFLNPQKLVDESKMICEQPFDVLFSSAWVAAFVQRR